MLNEGKLMESKKITLGGEEERNKDQNLSAEDKEIEMGFKKVGFSFLRKSVVDRNGRNIGSQKI